MSEKSNKSPITVKEEEVDLGQLFSVIGKMFTKLFNFIGMILKGAFHFLIIGLIFLKEHIIKLLFVVLLGAIIGFSSDYFSKSKYTYDMIIQPNYKAIDQIYESLEYYNVLIEQEDSIALAEKFDISYESANNLLEFRLTSYDTEKDKLLAYDKFVKTTDTLTQKNFSYATFKSDKESKFDSDKYVFRVVSHDTKLKSFEKKIINDINNNNTLQNSRRIKLSILKLDSIATVNAINNASELRDLYKEVTLKEVTNPKDASNTYIDFSKETKQNNDIELFEIVKKLNKNLIELEKEKERSVNIVNVITPFNSSGKEVKIVSYETKAFKYGTLFGSLMVLFLLLKGLKKYLENYK